MNLDKAREAYKNDPQYHHLVTMLVNQIEALEMTPSEIRETAMFACIICERRRMHPRIMLKDALKDVVAGSTEEEYRKFVLGSWDPVTEVKEKKEEDLSW